MNFSGVKSPFDGDVELVEVFQVETIDRMYQAKCGFEVAQFFDHVEDESLYLLRCKKTGYKFWYPFGLGGDEQFYSTLGSTWPYYYKAERWEYEWARKFIAPGSDVLEVGAGRGYFLKGIEKKVNSCCGLEVNKDAIRNKVCQAQLHEELIEEHAPLGRKYDVVASFQVLEHVEDPCSFFMSALELLNDQGHLILSTPNDDFEPHMNFEDAFNLPPHHLGHFNKFVYERLGTLFDLDIVFLSNQPGDLFVSRFFHILEPSLQMKVNKALRCGLRLISSQLPEKNGHSVVCVYKKKGRTLTNRVFQ